MFDFFAKLFDRPTSLIAGIVEHGVAFTGGCTSCRIWLFSQLV